MNSDQEVPQEGTAQELDVFLEASEETVEAGGKPPVIMIEDEVVAAAAEHGQQDTSCEQAGVLVGHVANGPQGPVVCVEVAIPAGHTEATRSRVTFTHDTWSDIYRVIDSQYSDKQIVGWYHTHPGFGIFLSEYDLFIHRNFFTAPWQIAYVIDPLSQEAGCFSWQGSDIAPTEGYNIYSPAAGRELAAPLVSLSSGYVPKGSLGQSRPLNIIILAVLGLVLALQLVNMLLIAGRLGGREAVLGPKRPVAGPTTPVQEQLAEHTTLLEDIQKGLADVRSGLGIRYEWCEVKPGDSLWKIAKKAYGRGDMAGLIAAENGLSRGGVDLEPGMRLRIPKLPDNSDERGQPGQ